MFVVQDDNAIYATRGDIVFFYVGAEMDGAKYTFQPGDVVRIKIFGKKDCESVVLQKDFPVEEAAQSVAITLTEEDTKFGEVISKPRDYWYEVELNPDTDPQTIIGYDEDGPRVFKLFPEGKDIPEKPVEPETVKVMDAELDLTSHRPVENQAVARAVARLDSEQKHSTSVLTGEVKALREASKANSKDIGVERARVDNLIVHKPETLSQSLGYLDVISEGTRAKIDATITSDGVFASVKVNLREANLIYGGTELDLFIIPDKCRPMEVGLVHTEDGLEYRIKYDGANSRYYMSIKAQDSVTVAPSGAGTVSFAYALGDYELRDVRVGADGVTYENAGTSVREQLKRKVDINGKRQVSPVNTTFFDVVMGENCFDASTMLEGKAPDASGVLVDDSTKKCTTQIEVDGAFVDAVAISENDTTHWVTSITFYNNGVFIERVKNVHTPVAVPDGSTHVVVAWTVEGDATGYFVGFNDTGSAMAYSDYVPGRIVSAVIKPEHLPQHDSKTAYVDLFLFMGQSNMAGRGNYLDAPDIEDGAGYEFRAVSDPTQLYRIEEPFGANENVSGAINDAFSDGSISKTGGMVSAFVNAYYKHTKTPIVGVSASEGGTDISAWVPGGKRLSDAIQRLDNAVAFLEGNNYSIRHKFVLWCQGESDGDRGTEKAVYVERFESMLSELILHGVEKLFMVRIGNCNISDDKGRYADVIEWQTEIAQENENVVMATTVFASMRDRGLMKDSFHYLQAGYNEAGTFAGVNVSQYVNSGKEPTMYDTEGGCLYYSHKN